MSKHIVTGIKPYDFTDEHGQRLQGVKVYYLSDTPENDSYARGFFPLNLSVLGDHVQSFKAIPGVYDLDFRQQADKYGKPVMKLRAATFVKPVDLPAI